MKQIALLFCVLACVCCSRSEQAQDKRIVRTALSANPMSLDPRVGGNRGSQVVIRMLFEGLTRISPEGKAEPAMAKSIEVSDDGCQYVFHLRDAYWSNGEPVTAEDFAYSWRKVCSPDFDSRFAYAFYTIRNAEAAKQGKVPLEELGVRAIDEKTLLVELDHPAPYFLDHIANPVCCPVNRRVDQENPNWHHSVESFVSNGVFTLDRWKRDSEISMTKNPNYWDTDSVKLDGVSIAIIEDASTTFAMFEKGELNWLGEPFADLPIDVQPRLKAAGQLETQDIDGCYLFFVNCSRFPYTSAKIRQALSYAVDRQELVDNLLKGQERVATSLLPPTLSLHDEPLLRDGDPEAARASFAEGLVELGISREEFPAITLNYGNMEGHKALAQAVQQCWQKVLGIRVDIEENEWVVFWTRLADHDYGVGGMEWYSWYNDPIYFLEMVKHAFHGLNMTGWEHPRYIELLDLADQEQDQGKRRGYLRQAEALVMEQMPVIPIHEIEYKYVRDDALSGVFISRKGMIDLKYASLNQPSRASSGLLQRRLQEENRFADAEESHLVVASHS